MSNSDMTNSTQDTLIARLQGAEGVTFGKQHTTTRTTERHTDEHFPTIITTVARVMWSLGEGKLAEESGDCVASRRPVTWVPLRTLGVLGPPPFFCAATLPTLVREYLFLVAVGTRSL